MTCGWPCSDAFFDELQMFGFFGFFTIPFFVYLGLVALGVRSLPASKGGGGGRRLLGPVFIGYYYWLLAPLFRAVNRTGLRPNQITWASLVAAAVTAAAIATGHFALASWLLIGTATLDIVDGQLARAKGMNSASGAFLDSTIDRVSDGLVFAGCAVYYAGSPMMVISLLVLVMSFTVSYARSRAEALGIVGAEGLMQRGDRITVLSIALAMSPFFGHRAEGFVRHPFYAVTAGALCLLALLNTATAISRITWTMRALAERQATKGSQDARSGDRVGPAADAPEVDVFRPAPNESAPLFNHRTR